MYFAQCIMNSFFSFASPTMRRLPTSARTYNDRDLWQYRLLSDLQR